MLGVLDAITRDPDLGPRQRDVLLTLYRQLVEQRRAELAETESAEQVAPEDPGGDQASEEQGSG